MKPPVKRTETRRATIRDVASAAGVSDMTVSRSLNAPNTVRPETRRKVELAVSELGYEPNAMARGMRTSSTSTIGFILPDITNTTNASIAQAAELVFTRAKYRMMLLATGYSARAEADFLARVPGNIVDGIVVALSDETDPTIHELLSSLSVPYVVLDRDLPFATDSIKSEHESAMHEALRHLVRLGHRRIGLVMSPLVIRPGRARIEAFRAFMKEHGLADSDRLIRTVPQTVEDGRDAMTALLNENPRPSAIIVGSNQLTFGAMQAIRAAGLTIPDDISVIGADDKVLTDLLTPPLTVIWRDMAEVGRAAAKLLLARLSGDVGPPRNITINSELILRASCGPPSAWSRSTGA
jgi:LacI family transcriptional regulator